MSDVIHKTYSQKVKIQNTLSTTCYHPLIHAVEWVFGSYQLQRPLGITTRYRRDFYDRACADTRHFWCLVFNV